MSNSPVVLFVSGKKSDREEFWNRIESRIAPVERCIYNDKNIKSRKVISRIQNNIKKNCFDYHPIMIFEGIKSNVVKEVGDEVDGVVIEIHLNKFNKKLVEYQIDEYLEFLRKL